MAADVVQADPIGPVFELVDGSTAQRVVWVRARSDLDMATAPLARHELDGLLSADGPDRMLVELGGGCFVDLHGLRVLVDVAERIRVRGGELVVVAPPRGLRIMIGVTGLGAELSFARTTVHDARWLRASGTSSAG